MIFICNFQYILTMKNLNSGDYFFVNGITIILVFVLKDNETQENFLRSVHCE